VKKSQATFKSGFPIRHIIVLGSLKIVKPSPKKATFISTNFGTIGRHLCGSLLIGMLIT